MNSETCNEPILQCEDCGSYAKESKPIKHKKNCPTRCI